MAKKLKSIDELRKAQQDAVNLFNTAITNLQKTGEDINKQIDERMQEITRINEECQHLKDIKDVGDGILRKL